MSNVAWTAILSAFLITASIVVGIVALIQGDDSLLRFAGLVGLGGVGWALLALRDDR